METKKKYPLWVRLGLWGSYKRSTLISASRIALVFSLLFFGDVIYSKIREDVFEVREILLGLFFLLGFLYYRIILRWISRNGGWEDADSHEVTFKEWIVSFLIMVGVVTVVVLGIKMI